MNQLSLNRAPTKTQSQSEMSELSRSFGLDQINLFPEMHYMASKKRLLSWIHGILERLDFETALDPFSGSGSITYIYLIKAIDRRTLSSNFLNLSATLGKALIENNSIHLDRPLMKRLLAKSDHSLSFMEENFTGVFYNPEDLKFLDRVSCNILA